MQDSAAPGSVPSAVRASRAGNAGASPGCDRAVAVSVTVVTAPDARSWSARRVRRSRTASPVLLAAGALVLTACGSQAATGSQAPAPPGGTSACGVPTDRSASASAPVGDPAERELNGVRITGSGPLCTEFEVTNRGSEPFTYTVTFTHLSQAGQAMSVSRQTVPDVAPGRTVAGTVAAGGPSSALPEQHMVGVVPTGAGASASAGGGRVRITRVRSVPSKEASAEPGVCPPSGTRVYADEGDAAMGLRVLGLHLENCGAGTVELNGYPELQVVDEEHRPVGSVRILHGGSAISTGTGADEPPRPVTLGPGERAYAGLVWRNTVEAGTADPVNAPYLRVRAKAGADPVMVIPELDLGTTGRLGVGAWKQDRTLPASATGVPGTRP
ncbi:DUF4232 domain-containing protein [Kitasatospora sp. KL5]|uniref:DUF4232 domain-containing protein n=1 Tax=Kitasatospora sp. KL5 TaxID=3425125 RepID=UPI003D701400